MKTFLSLAIISLALPCHSAVIQNDAMILQPNVPPNPFSEQLFAVASAPSLFLRLSSTLENQFTFQYMAIAEAYSLFIVTGGTDFDTAYVNSHTSFVNNWNNPGTGILTLSPGQSAYIGYWDQESGPQRMTAQDSDLFGWALVTNSAGNLIVSSSATATEGGIKIGTLQQIPEPNMMWSVGGGLTLCCLRRNRAKQRPEPVS